MWLLMVNGLIYLALGFATGRFRKKLLPITPEGVIADTKAALTGKLSHDDLIEIQLRAEAALCRRSSWSAS